MAHLLPANQQQEIQEAGEEAEESVSEQLSPVEIPQSPNAGGDLHYRQGYTDATLAQLLAERQQERLILQQQAAEVARLAAQTEMQEEQIAKKTAQVTAERKEPGIWEKLFGGHNRSSSRPPEE